jgi:hypothetical protein
MNKKGDSNLSVCMRIMTNYLQVITSAMSYNLKFPGYFLDIFYPVTKIGASSEAILSFDCMISDFNATTSSTSFFKILLTALLPIPLILLFSLFWIGLGQIWNRFKDFKRSIAVSILTIIFILHPTLINSSLKLYQCIDVGQGVSKTALSLLYKLSNLC